MAGWNASLLVAGLVLIGLAGEVWLRSTVPFGTSVVPTVFVPGVGVMLRPDTEIYWTNHHDFWTVSRTNRLGFLDREPPSPARAGQSCHIAMIGDSFVEAMDVPIPDKFHVRLEEMAARELPALDVTTSAFGRGNTGQIGQLPFYDEYARPLRPKLVVLVFYLNDYIDNFPLWWSLRYRFDPEHLPYVSAARTDDGGLRLRPPDPDSRRFRQPPPATPQWRKLLRRWLRASRFLLWLLDKDEHDPIFNEREFYAMHHARRVHWMELLSRRPAYAPLLDGWRPFADQYHPNHQALIQDGNDSPFYKEALAFTAFGLEQFQERAARDGTALAILVTQHRARRLGVDVLAPLNEMAAERGIPVIDQADFIERQGAEPRDARWTYDSHWTPTGHQWAAEALLEYLKQNQDVCG